MFLLCDRNFLQISFSQSCPGSSEAYVSGEVFMVIITIKVWHVRQILTAECDAPTYNIGNVLARTMNEQFIHNQGFASIYWNLFQREFVNELF